MRLQAEPGLAHEACRNYNPYYNYTTAMIDNYTAHHKY